MSTNVKKQSAFAANASRVAVERASVGDLKGAAEVLQLAATDSGVGAAVAYFGMRDRTGLRVVALCDRETLLPIAGDALSDVLRVVHETGGTPPRARKHVWRVMGLAELRRQASGTTNALFYALHAFNTTTTEGMKAHHLLPQIHNFCVWRVLHPEYTSPAHGSGKVYTVATRGPQRVMPPTLMLEAYLCVLADALQARDQSLVGPMVLSISNLLRFVEQDPKLFRGGPNGRRMAPMELSAYATKLARALEDRRVASDADLGIGWTTARKLEAGNAVVRLRDDGNVHPLDYYAAVRIVMLNGADPPTPARDASQCFARAVYEWSPHSPMLAMIFDQTDVASPTAHEMAAPAYVLRVLTDAFAHLAAKNIKATTEDAIVDELVAHARAGHVQHALREAFVVVQWSKCPRGGWVSAYHHVTRAATAFATVEELVMALVPEAARLPDAQRAVRMALAEIVYQNGSQTKKDSKYDLLDPGWLFCAQRESARMPGIRAHLRAKAAEHAKTLAESRSVLANAAVRLYHYERGGQLASAELVKLQLRGDPKYVRGVYMRLAHALVTGDLDFVRRCVADPGAFSARTLRRAVAPLVRTDAEAAALGLTNWRASHRAHRVRSSRKRRDTTRVVHDLFLMDEEDENGLPCVCRSFLDPEYANLPAPFDVPVRPEVDARHSVRPSAALDVRPEPPAPAPAPAPAAPAPVCAVGERVYESLEVLSAEIEAATSAVACCPICLEDQPKADMVHVHPDSGHPDDYKLCGACAPKVKKCPFCRADSTTYVRTLADAPLPTPRTYYQSTYRPLSPNSFDLAAGVDAYTSESSEDDVRDFEPID